MRNVRFGRTGGAVCAAAMGLLVAWFPLAGSAVADAVPFTDPSASGYIGFCDQHGHQVRSGNIGSAPFAWTAVASTPAPPGFGAGVGRGVLNIYQPIKDVDPGDWSGKQMTAASIYTNGKYPMAQATGADPALVDFVAAFPPRWDGLVQLRLYFSAPSKPLHSRPYPATVLRVSGDTWTVVSGGNVPCNAGKATSAETISLPSSVLNRATARSTPDPGGGGAATGTAARRGTSTGASTTDPGKSRGGSASATARSSSGSGQVPDGAVASAVGDASKKSSGGSGSTIALIVLAMAVVAGAATAFVRRRR